MQNRALKTLFVYNGIFIFAGSLLGPLYAVFVKTIDENIISVSLSWSVFLISTTVFMLVVRKYGDLVKEKEYLLITGYLIRAMVWFTFPSISTVTSLVVLQILLGLGESLGTPAYDAIFAEHLDKNRHIKEYTDWKLISNIASAVAVLLGGFMIRVVGFPVLFYLMGSLAVISLVGILIKPRELL